MLGAGLQFNRSRGDDRFFMNGKLRRNFNHSLDHDNNNNHHFSNDYINQNNQMKPPQLERTQSDVVNGGKCKDRMVISGFREPENRMEEKSKPVVGLKGFDPVELPLSNVERFLEAITPSVHAQYLSKTTMRGLKKCDVEFQPYFVLGDLWESFKEWSAYGAGVPLVLNGSDSVVQYYVPYLSAIQLFADPSKSSVKSRRTSEDSDGDYLSRDSSSDGSSDSERDRGSMLSRGQQNGHSNACDLTFRMERLFLKDQQTQEDLSSDDGDSVSSQGSLLFQYFEHCTPYGREPLADKISDLALRLPELKTIRSCDLLSSSWFSVAWYPIYRIPTGPTLRDLDACFLTYHSLHTPVGDAPPGQAPVVIYPSEIDGIPRISLPAFGLASYKFMGPVWISSSGSDRQLVSSLLQAAESWLRLLQVNHPDYLFFCRNR